MACAPWIMALTIARFFGDIASCWCHGYTMTNRARGCLLGLAVGDALGTTYEFQRISQPPYPTLATAPATDVVGKGPFNLQAGQITDDTQLAICLARSLAERGRFDLDDAAGRYVAWSREAFDIGSQTGASLSRIEDGEPVLQASFAVWRGTDRRAAGNGSLMRTGPLAVALRVTPGALVEAALLESMITHADPRCALACAVFDRAIAAAITDGLEGRGMVDVARDALAPAAARMHALWRDNLDVDHDDAVAIERARLDLASDLDAALASEPGVYTDALHLDRTAGFVRVAFRLACWHAVHTAGWREAVVDVASRGGDADTNAAIVGAFLGARDGDAAIPAMWIERVLGARQPGSAAWADAHHPRHLLALL
ncbi:MAG: ADP-ribosylglycohydrolase family protein [Kofleriaceae bacterium]|nr:ADP-ribosylglycohydrolase family protein [Kofleriaceae bacterium]